MRQEQIDVQNKPGKEQWTRDSSGSVEKSFQSTYILKVNCQKLLLFEKCSVRDNEVKFIRDFFLVHKDEVAIKYHA